MSSGGEESGSELRLHFACQRCQNWLSVPLRSLGSSERCPACGWRLKVPPLSAQVQGLQAVLDLLGPAARVRLTCPECQRRLEVPVRDAPPAVLCPACGARLKLGLLSTDHRPPARAAEAGRHTEEPAGPPPAPATSTRPADTAAGGWGGDQARPGGAPTSSRPADAAANVPPAGPASVLQTARRWCRATAPAVLLGAVLLVAVWLIVVVVRAASGPKFDPEDLTRTRTWLARRLATLDRLVRDQNQIAYSEARQELGQQLQALVGAEIQWQVPVRKVTASQVVLQTRWPEFDLAILPRDEPLRWDNCFALRIGDQIPFDRAAALHRDQPVLITGRLTEASLQADGRVLLQLNHVKAP